jgi:hypothetical protein
MAVSKEGDPERMGNLPKRVEPKGSNRYDSSLQMFVMAPSEPDYSRLKFLRWLAEQNRLEHRVAGPSSGQIVDEVRVKPDAGVAG